MNPISTTSHPPPPPTQSEKRTTVVVSECAEKNCEMKTLGTAKASAQQAKEHPKPNCKSTAKKPLARVVNHRRYHSKMNSTNQVTYKQQQTQQRGVENTVNLRRRFACCKLAAAKSICRHRSCKALSSSSSLPLSSARKSSKALANLHNVTTNFVLGVGNQTRPGNGEAAEDVNNNFEKLMLSLQSPLPNEHSLTLNTLMILSSVVRDKEVNILEKTPALLNMLLAHVGFYGDCALRLLMEQSCGEHRDFKAFWSEVRSEIEDAFQLRQQLLCECFPQVNLPFDGKCCDGCGAFRDQFSMNKPPHMALPVASEKVGGQVLQIGHILRNLSFEGGNAYRMAMNETMLRFLLVAGTSEYESLPQISFDIISNITKYIDLKSCSVNDMGALCQLHAIIIDLVTSTFMNSGDRFKILRCLEALQGLALSSGDREAKRRIFGDMRLFEKLFQFLTLKEDTILVINCLECLLAVTAEGMGKNICHKIIESVRGCVGTLVSYLTVDVMENFVNRKDGFWKENFRTELVGIEGALSDQKNIFSEAVSNAKKLNGSVGSATCAKNKAFRVMSQAFSTKKQSSLGNSSSQTPEKYHSTPISSSQRKLGPSDEATAIMENVKKIPEGKPITLMLSPEALSLLERSPELKIKRLNFPTDNLHSSNSVDKREKICVELVHYQNNNFLKKSPNGMICSPLQSIPLLSSLTFSLATLNDSLETAIPFQCEWDYCGSRHISKIQLRWHVYLWHLPNSKDEKSKSILCKWGSRASPKESCSYPRNKYDLLEHLMEHHYNDKALDKAFHQRIIKNIISPASRIENSMTSSGQGDYQNGTSGGPRTATLGYGSQQQQQIEEKEEHVVNKSVRLTAALILRNFVNTSGQARRSLRKYEMHLAEVAMGGYDYSGVVSHVLHYLSEDYKDENMQ